MSENEFKLLRRGHLPLFNGRWQLRSVAKDAHEVWVRDTTFGQIAVLNVGVSDRSLSQCIAIAAVSLADAVLFIITIDQMLTTSRASRGQRYMIIVVTHY